MNRLLSIVMLAITLIAMSMAAHAREESASASAGASAHAEQDYNWQKGPLLATFYDQATLKVPGGYAFLAYKDAQKLLVSLGNPDVKNVLGVIADGSREWMVVVRFDKTGYIKDGEAKSLHAESLLETIRKSAEKTNVIRSKLNMPALEILGWLEKPAYDPKANRMTLGIAVRDKYTVDPNSQGINFNTYLLGRQGYISLNMVTSLQNIGRHKSHLTKLLSGLSFKDGKKYADVKGGDKVAPFGMNELAAGSVPTRKPGLRGAIQGFFADYGKWLLIFIVLILLGVGGFFGWRYWKKHHGAPESLLSEPVEPTMEQSAGAEQKDA
ncbi:MAG: DUF2167 domain-containing protein [Burkholderiales bacterium]|nr:DUF2167 domain-containing protein [Burkholderiales bacterium]